MPITMQTPVVFPNTRFPGLPCSAVSAVSPCVCDMSADAMSRRVGKQRRASVLTTQGSDQDTGKDTDSINLLVPGRICPLASTDWAGSFTLSNSDITPGVTIVVGTNQGIHARVRKHATSMVLTATHNDGSRNGPFEIPMEKEALLKVAKEGGFCPMRLASGTRS